MYHKIGIQRLSPTQISKLLNGHKIRVKHGQGHEIHASAEQHKKIMAAHRKGKAHTMQFDPFQIAQHQHLRHGHKPVHHAPMHHGYGEGEGEGIFGSVARAVAPVARAVAPTLIDYGANALKHRLTGHGEGMKHRGRPRKHAPKHHASMGEGRAVGRRRRGKGDGLFGSIAHAAAPVMIDYGAKALKSRLGHGEGMHSRSMYSHQSHGEALYPAGYGEGEGMKRRGRKSKGEGKIGSMIGSHLGSLAGNFLPF